MENAGERRNKKVNRRKNKTGNDEQDKKKDNNRGYVGEKEMLIGI